MKLNEENKIVDLASRRKNTTEQMLERLFREHRAALRGFVRARSESQSEVDDVIQEVFLKLANMADLEQRVSPATGSNRAFILTIANNLMADMHRRKELQRRHQDVCLQAPEEEALNISPETIAHNGEELDLVRRAIMDLRPNWRRAFILNRFEHKSYSQIAVEMGVSVKQIEKYMSKALARIRSAVPAIENKR